MVAGHLGLGVCPSMEPLDRAVLTEAVSWLARPGTLSVGDMPAGSGSLDLDWIDWAAVWQAGEPPEAWLDPPELYGTRTPGGFTLDGPVETLSRATLPTPAAALVSLDDPIEQALVLMGAEAVQVPCRVTGMDRACTTTGQLRRPRGQSLVVVDQPDAVAVHIDLVGALSDAPGSVRVARATYGPHSAVGRALQSRARARDHVMQVEPVRFRSSVRVSMDHAATVVGWFLSPEAVDGSEDVPWSGGDDGVVGVWESRLEARPWERVHDPSAQVERGPSSSGRAMDTLLVIRGPAERLRTELAASGVEADRVLSAAQLAAEARSIHPLGASEAP